MVQIELYQNQSLICPWMKSLEAPCTAYIRKHLQGYDLVRAKQDLQRFRRETNVEETAMITRIGLIITPVPLFSANEECAIFYTGLLDVIVKNLNKLKVPYQITDKRDKQNLLQALPYVEGVSYREHQEDVLLKLLSKHNGIIKAPPAFGKSFVIGVYCKIRSPHETIMVVTNRVSVLKELHTRIVKDIGEKNTTLVCTGHKFNDKARVAIVSSASMQHIPSDWPSVLLYDEVHGAAAPEVGRALMRFYSARLYGFSGTPKGRGDGGDLIGTALFGSVIHEITYDEAKKAGNVSDMEVRVVDVHGTLDVKVKTPVDFNRQYYWRNTIRNKKIAEVVSILERDGIDKILIMVETAEHAYYLRMHLPTFEVVHTPLAPAKIKQFGEMGLLRPGELCNPDADEIKKGFRDSLYRKVIATMKWREGVDLPDLPVVIRADGQCGVIATIQIGGRVSRTCAGKSIGLVVDFRDHFCKETFYKSCAKISHYRTEGWRVVEWKV